MNAALTTAYATSSDCRADVTSKVCVPNVGTSLGFPSYMPPGITDAT